MFSDYHILNSYHRVQHNMNIVVDVYWVGDSVVIQGDDIWIHLSLLDIEELSVVCTAIHQ